MKGKINNTIPVMCTVGPSSPLPPAVRGSLSCLVALCHAGGRSTVGYIAYCLVYFAGSSVSGIGIGKEKDGGFLSDFSGYNFIKLTLLLG